MKRILALALVVLMCASALVLAACQKTTTEATKPVETPTPTTPTPVTPTPARDPEDDAPFDTPDFITELNYSSEKPEHKKAESLPSSATLVGTDTLPPIDNSGDIACSFSETTAYTQFTNAVARYLKEQDPSNDWKPAADYKSCFSPKFSYSTTPEGSYNKLMLYGALTNAQDGFYKNAMDVSIFKRNGEYLTDSTKWMLAEGTAQQSFKYRLRTYEVVGISSADNTIALGGYYDPETKGVRFSDSDPGRALIERIKDAIVTGNVVVVKGYYHDFLIEKLTANTGTLGKAGDSVIPYATKHSGSDTMALSIVGYDDDFEYTTCGVTMKGAFLVSNSVGKSWGTNGYCWMTYDSFNTNSEYEGFELPLDASGAEQTKEWALDCFYFVYWDTDVIVDKAPALYAEVKMSVSDRSSLTITAQRTDAYGRTASAGNTPSVPNFGLTGKSFFNPDGVENGAAVDGCYVVSFSTLLSSIPVGATYENFTWGIKIASANELEPITVKSITLKNSAGEVVKAVDLGDGEVLAKKTFTYVFDFGEQLAQTTLNGNYKLKNVATGNYIAKDASNVNLVKGGEAEAATFAIKLNEKTNKVNFYRDADVDKNWVVDLKNIKNNEAARCQPFNEKDRAAEQSWIVSYNPDNTFTFFMVNADGAYYALSESEEGKIVIRRARALTDDIKWSVDRVNDISVTSSSYVPMFATRTETGLVISGVTSAKKVANVALKAYDFETGAEVASTTATASSRLFKAELALGPGSYEVRLYDAGNENATDAFAYYVTVK